MFVVRFFTKFDKTLPHYQKSSAQVLQSAPGELGSGAANRSVNPDLICPPYILWPRRIRVGSDPLSPDPQPIVARSQPLSRDLRCHRMSSTRRRPTLYPSSGIAYLSSPVSFFNSRTCRRSLRIRRHELSIRHRALQTRRRAVRTRRRALHTRRRAVWTRRRDPSRACPAPVRAHPISTRAFHYSPALCQSIPACTCHDNCLRDSLKDASYFSSHVIHHD